MFLGMQCLILAVIGLLVEKIYSLPYIGPCRDDATEYTVGGRCCRKCEPGTRLQTECSADSDTTCEPCPHGSFQDKWNYYNKCFSCPQCKEDKSMQYAQQCTRSTKSLCMCQTGTYCSDYQKPTCIECRRYKRCLPGQGVTRAGTADSNVKCAPCAEGTFSDQLSYSQTCQRHTECESQGRDVLQRGNSKSDTVCRLPHVTAGPIPESTTLPTTPPSDTTTTPERPPQSSLLPDKVTDVPLTDSSPILTTDSSSVPSMLIGWAFLGVAGVLVVLLICVGTLLYRKGSYQITDKEANKPGPSCAVPSHHTYVQPSPLEQQSLLVDHHDPSMSSMESQTESSHSMGCASSQEVVLVENPQPTSPQVNVNITTTINYAGPCSLPLSPSTHSPQADPEIPLSQEEVCPPSQREGNKEARDAVQESGKSLC